MGPHKMIAGFHSSAVFTPAAAAYSAADIMAGAKEFPNMGLQGSRTVIKIIGTTLMVAHTALVASEAAYSLHLYSATPPSALADNDPFDIPSGDRAYYLGKLGLGTPVDLGSTLFIATAQTAIVIPVPVGGSLWGYLATDAGITPTAAARTVTLMAEAAI